MYTITDNLKNKKLFFDELNCFVNIHLFIFQMKVKKKTLNRNQNAVRIVRKWLKQKRKYASTNLKFPFHSSTNSKTIANADSKSIPIIADIDSKSISNSKHDNDSKEKIDLSQQVFYHLPCDATITIPCYRCSRRIQSDQIETVANRLLVGFGSKKWAIACKTCA